MKRRVTVKGERQPNMNEEWLIETVEIDRETIEEILRESVANMQ